MNEQANKVSFRRRLIRLLDRPGGRFLLGKFATFFARRLGKRDLEIFYDDIWIHRLLTEYYADSGSFNYYRWHFLNWPSRHRQWRDEARVRWFSRYQPKLGDVILDIGAGMGTDTIIFSGAVGQDGHVYAIEANADAYRLLLKTCHWNNHDNVTCLQAKVEDKAGAVGSDPGGNEEGISVPTVTVDDIFDRYGLDEVGLLKMSIGGGERHAIKGMSASIGKIRNIAIAFHDIPTDQAGEASTSTREEVVEFLERNDFDVFVRTNETGPHALAHVYGVRMPCAGEE